MPYKALKSRLYLEPDQHQFLLSLMRASKSLYNQALYNVRQHFLKTNEYLSYNDNYKLLKDMFVYIRYFAVRSKDGKFLGTLEITQNIKPIRELVGEKRLVSKD